MQFRSAVLADTMDLVDHGTHWTGKFRAGCEAIGAPRILVFRVSGTINIAQSDGVNIENPHITIACNTAPGE